MSSPHFQRRDVYQQLQQVYQMQSSDSAATFLDVSFGTHSEEVSSVRTFLQVFTMYIGYQSNVTKLHTSVSVPNKTGRFMNLRTNISKLLIFYWLNAVV